MQGSLSPDTVALSARPSRAGGGQQEVPMRTIVEDRYLPVDINAQPVVQAAAALKPTLRYYHDDIEREQRLSPELVEQMHAAGFYRLLLPRSLGGLQADPLTYICVVELLAEGAGSVGWNVANNGVGQLVTLGLPDDGVQEIYPKDHRTVIAGTAVQGGGQAVSVQGGYRVSGRWTFGSGGHEAAWMLGSFRFSTTASRAAATTAACSGAACSRAPRSRSFPAAGR